eukprot:871708-Pleurochrysis_carterae.AAC.1
MSALGCHDVDHTGKLVSSALGRPCVAAKSEPRRFRAVVAPPGFQIIHPIRFVFLALDHPP